MCQTHSNSMALSLDKPCVKQTPSIMQLGCRGSSSSRCSLNLRYVLLSALYQVHYSPTETHILVHGGTVFNRPAGFRFITTMQEGVCQQPWSRIAPSYGRSPHALSELVIFSLYQPWWCLLVQNVRQQLGTNLPRVLCYGLWLWSIK